MEEHHPIEFWQGTYEQYKKHIEEGSKQREADKDNVTDNANKGGNS